MQLPVWTEEALAIISEHCSQERVSQVTALRAFFLGAGSTSQDFAPYLAQLNKPDLDCSREVCSPVPSEERFYNPPQNQGFLSQHSGQGNTEPVKIRHNYSILTQSQMQRFRLEISSFYFYTKMIFSLLFNSEGCILPLNSSIT